MSPKLKSLLARLTLFGGVALVASLAARELPREQVLVVRLGSRDIAHIEGVISERGADEPTAGFSRVFPERSPAYVRYAFKARTGTYTVVIMFAERSTGEGRPNLTETTFERQVSLAGGEVIVSPD